MTSLTRAAVASLLRLALQEDGASRDVTSRVLLSPKTRIRARIVARTPGILAGGRFAVWTFQTRDRSLRCVLKRADGAQLSRGDTILTVHGRARSIFAAERTALNLLMHLSGIATMTREFVRRTRGTHAKIYDTRKTLPGLRALEKYAVRVGGGRNHRSSLAEAILIKTNHLRAMVRGRTSHVARRKLMLNAMREAKQVRPRKFVEVEVTNLQEFRMALEAKPDAILLDNWVLNDIRKAVRIRHSALRTPHSALRLEVSGGVTLADVRAIARTGVDRISIGHLTHSAPSLDLSLEII